MVNRLPLIGAAVLNLEHRITSEYAPSGDGLPSWLYQAFSSAEPPNIMVIHPNELHRQRTIEWLDEQHITVIPQHHLTMNRLVRSLHTDLRLPVLLDNDVGNFLALHARCVDAAEAGDFAVLHVPGVGAWTMAKTQRLQRLHAALMELRRPFAWENEPGVAVYHQLVLEHERETGGTLPVMVTPHVLKALLENEAPPFGLSSIDGVVLLDMAPDFSELEQDLLVAVSRHVPVHQVLHPGSFRLGFHGAYVVDEPPCTEENLPSWLPPHTLWNPLDDHWRTSYGEQRNTTLTRIPVDDRAHVRDAVVTFVQAFREHQPTGHVMIVDGAVQSRGSAWSKALADIGISWGSTQAALDQQPVFNAVMKAANLGLGMSSWSLESLLGLFASTTLPFNDDMFTSLVHPKHPTWRPKPDATVLEEISRQFHVLGGPGAMARWLGVMSQARPSFSERRPEQKRQVLEETQWFLACLFHAWRPLLAPEDRHWLRNEVIGCSSGEVLPVPDSSNNGMAWLSWLMSTMDVGQLHERRAPYDAGLGTLQTLFDGLKSVEEHLQACHRTLPSEGRAFVDILQYVGQSTSMSSANVRTSNIDIVTPEQALGCTADLILLAGLDVDAWPMRTPVVPWLDAQAQVELGMFQSDLLVRQGRHHLRHLLNAAPDIVVFDSTPEEGGGPSAPLAEWLNDVKRSRAWEAMRDPPAFLPDAFTTGEGEQRRFHWVVREAGHGSWLSPNQYSMVTTDDGQRRLRHGHGGADARQQLGLDVHASMPFTDRINHHAAVFDGYEAGIQGDRHRRQPTVKRLEDGETMLWDARDFLLSTDALALRPEKASVEAYGVLANAWPHLGHRSDGKVSLAVDPRPLPPYGEDGLAISHRFGLIDVPYDRTTWSPSRLEAWLKCPRMAWVKQSLLADDDDGTQSEDVDARVRGQVVHDAEAAVMTGHGVPLGGEMSEDILPLHQGPMGAGDAGWRAILAFLQRDVAWLGRQNAVSVHRTRDLVDATPEEWQAHQEGSLDLPARGRLARLLEADLALENAAPVALEWPTVTESERWVSLKTNDEDDEAVFNLFGYADRVDVLALTTTQQEVLREEGVLGDESHDTPFPLTGEGRTAQRLVVIRDLKSVPGPAPKYAGLRHFRCLFEDLQLALYARAWEVLHPNDRVVGVGASEIGEHTRHYVELDSQLERLDDSLALGELTRVFPRHFPTTDGESSYISSFRRWMAERLSVAQRAIETAAAGHVNPTPGTHCNYCVIAAGCAAHHKNGGGV